ncbi:hypothetical protein Bca52824_077718 [Brassica carinata]|uniref:Eukaryotic translation initiation factor 3 subunit C N-terminal domain-containing protein n=1 Tax=Brassica carinata TaxID=52824 RepID=A0A8X7PU49_BRACI|nr:hypothetical protein Bca52824_077718 [Brassica carinata]
MLKFYAQTESDSEYESNTEEELDEVQDTNTAGGASRNLLGRSDSGDVNDLHFLNETTLEAKNEMSHSNSKALNSMRQRLKKNNEEEINKYRESPETEEVKVSEEVLCNKEITWEWINQKFKVVSIRGRKGTSRSELLDQLTHLMRIAKTPAQKINRTKIISVSIKLTKDIKRVCISPRKIVHNKGK